MKRIKNFFVENWPFFAVLALMVAMILFGGCKAPKTIVQHDTAYVSKVEYHDRYVLDSVFVHDSMWMEAKGDTIWIDRWHTKYSLQTRIDTAVFRDTAYVERNVPYETIKYKTPRWCWCIIGIMVLMFALIAFYVCRFTKELED